MKRTLSIIGALSVLLALPIHWFSDDTAASGQVVGHSVSVATTATPLPSAVTERHTALAAAGLECPAAVAGSTMQLTPTLASDGIITGTTSADLADFAERFNEIRIAECLQPIPLANFRHDACMEQRLVWMAEDPSDDPLSAWGHIGSQRSDGKPSVGCDGNLAGGSDDTGATVAEKWWQSDAHRESLYQPDYQGAAAGVCIYFAATHGGVGTTVHESYDFMRATARWGSC